MVVKTWWVVMCEKPGEVPYQIGPNYEKKSWAEVGRANVKPKRDQKHCRVMRCETTMVEDD